MKSRIPLRTQLARVGACLALLNFAVPGGAIVAFGVPAREAIGKALAARRAAQRDLEARRRKSASRLLTDDEQGKMQGKTGENPYLAGGSKWDVVYKGVDLMTGNYSTSATDLSFDGGYGIPVNVTRSYSANQADEGPFGKGWTLSADVRSTAGGLLKSGSAPVRSIPLNLKERSDTEADPNVAVQPAQAVTAVDAGGTEETVQKDVDGILTTPAWDKNVYDSQYEWVTLNGQQYQVLVSNTVKIPEGTVYTYAKEGTYPNGTYAWNDPNQVAQAANVLKVTSATNRQGNVTTYSYGSGTVTFSHSNGTTVEHPLIGVSMPGGHFITLTWGQNANAASYMRLTSVSDGTGGRTVTYGYTGQAGHGLLASATSAGGKTTGYGYGAPYGGGSSDFLVTITGARGLTETIQYLLAQVPFKPSNTPVSGVVAYGLLHSNNTSTYIQIDFDGYDHTTPSDEPEYGLSNAPTRTGTRFGDFLGTGRSAVNYQVGEVYCYPMSNGAPFSVFLNDPRRPFTAPIPSIGSSFSAVWRKDYDVASQNLVTEGHRTYPGPWSGAPNRGFPAATWVAKLVETTKTYNFMGQPLAAATTESNIASDPNSQNPYPVQTVTCTAKVGYAYWGAEKYWQQKATKDQAGRIAVTDYYPSTAVAGKRGQSYRVYDPKYGSTGVNTNIAPPSYATSDTAWRYQVVWNANAYAAQFDYDAQGRPVDVWKLQSATTSPWTYVQTKTTYGADGPNGTWGQANQVVEDYGDASHVNRTTTTMRYTSWGKASDVVDAAGHEFVTDFDLDSQVNSVTRKDGGLNQTVVSYAYGSSGIENGQLTSVTDGLSGVTQAIAYCQSGGGIGMPASVTETNGSDSYTTAYTYTAVGDRATATYSTPSGTARWGYGDFVPVGDPASPSRAFQTLTRLDAGGNRTAEEFHYAYDSGGRLAAAAFAQSPFVDGQHQAYVPTTAGAPYYDASHLASRRALTTYAYDPGGRLMDVATNWQAAPDGGGSYVNTGIAENACAYEVNTGLNRGLKTSSAFTMANVAMNGYDTRTETYGYDASQDQLTSASYGDGNPNASPTWSYDAAGNRNDAVTDNLNRATSLGGAAVTNDVLGNRITKGGTTYGWDCLNRMTSLSGAVTAAYQYRADGMRVSKQTGGVTTLYRHDGQMGIEDVEVPTSGTATVTRYGLGARGVDLIERTNSSGTVTAFPIYDAHGNDVASLTRSGAGFSIGDRRSYDAWGVVRAQQSGGDPKLRYCASLGHKQDDESGLVYMRARYYEPASGRFVSEDTAMDGHNWFVYCNDNPVNLVDRTGKSPDGWFGAGILFAAAGIGAGMLCVCPLLDKLMAPLVSLVFGATTAALATGAVVCFALGFMGLDSHDKAVTGAVASLVAGVSASVFRLLMSGVEASLKELGNLGKVAGGLGYYCGVACAAQICAVTAAILCIDL